MGCWFAEGSSSSSSKRRRRDWDCDCNCATRSRPRRKKYLYLALDDSTGSYSIYKLDADDISDDSGRGGEHELPEPAAIRMNSPACGPMDFAALGAGIFAAPGPTHVTTPTAATTLPQPWSTKRGPLPSPRSRPFRLGSLPWGAAMAAGEKLYALTNQVLRVQALSWAPIDDGWNDEERDWIWSTVPSPPPCTGIWMSSPTRCTGRMHHLHVHRLRYPFLRHQQ